MNEKLRTLEDASSEITLSDEGLKYRLGDCFVEMDAETAESYLDAQVTQIKKRQRECEERIAHLKKELAELKVTLKARFGDAISLEK